jgi:hypothetical protein
MEELGFSVECGECERLLEEYRRLAREYLEMMRRRKLALLQPGWSVLAEIDSGLRAEQERRALAKRALLEHDVIHRAD